jgi:transposase-like protein
MEHCKGCGSAEIVRNGRDKQGTQRYKCRSCGSTYREGDKRLKYGLEKRLKVISMYLEGVGIRSIERLEGISNPLIIYWIRHFSELMRKELKRRPIPDSAKEIQILELDELFTYCKKSPNKSMYGLLLTEYETKLLISK